MQIKKVIITNFRSIKECTISFEKELQVLVGINEAGKSNILKAIALISSDYELTKNDIRDPLPNEDNVGLSFVRFIFSITKEDQKEICQQITQKILAKDPHSNLMTIGETEANIDSFIRHKQEALYTVDLIKQTRYCQHYTLVGPKYRISPEWQVVKKGKTQKLNINNNTLDISDFTIVNINDYPEIDKENLEILDITKLNNIVGNIFITLLNNQLPKCIFWNYKESNLLPGKINLNAFKQSPETCIPLKIMFNLAGIENLGQSITDAEGKVNGLKNLLKRVSDITTTHMKKVWPEWNKLRVHVVQNGEFIDAGIEDEFNFYSLERRSDGFKRFFTFLLMMSAQNKTNDIQNTIILIDEPEGGLHPSGQVYLREELLKIAKNNIVLIATHSIFMVDKEQTDRHLIVSKAKEITSIETVSSSNITNEEVIFKALGYSIFELLKPSNIIFEGWRDKKIFDTFIKSKSGITGESKKKSISIGQLHASGVKDVSRIANICENFNRKYVIITDSDKPAIEKKREHTGIGQWILYTDIDGINAITTEDFIYKKTINAAIKSVFKKYYLPTPNIFASESECNCMAKIDSHLKGILDPSLDIKKILNDIKEYLATNIKAEDLKPEYKNVVLHLLSLLD